MPPIMRLLPQLVKRRIVPIVVSPSRMLPQLRRERYSNNEGHFDKVVVSRVDKVAQAAKAAHVAKYAPYHAAVATTREAAYRAHSGQSVENVAAAQESAVAQFNADYAGEIPVPPAK